MKAIGFNGGQFGDLAMCTVCARAFKQQHPDGELYFAVGKPYEGFLPLVAGDPLFKGVHVWEGYEPWPQPQDKKFLDEKKFDIVFNPLAKHVCHDWYNVYVNQSAALCAMHGLEPPEDLSVKLVKFWDDTLQWRNFVALSVFPGYGRGERSLRLDRASLVVKLLDKLGFRSIQLGTANEPPIPGAARFFGSYYETVRLMLGCRCLVTGDTGLSWVASGYRHPVFGLYGWLSSYPGLASPKVYEPINPNAVYLEAPDVNQIPMETIESGLKDFLKK